MYWITHTTINWDDELSRYELAKRVCESTNNKEELLYLESEVKRLTEAILEKWQDDDYECLKCYLTQKIDHIFYPLLD